MGRISGTLMAVAIAAFAYGVAAPADVIKERRANFKINGDLMKAMPKALAAGDFATIESGAGTIAAWAAKMTGYFPEGSDSGDTEARDEIWFEFDRFTEYAKANEAAARELMALAASGDASAVGGGLGKLGGTCKTCHDSFKF